jgi:hypothetical protein
MNSIFINLHVSILWNYRRYLGLHPKPTSGKGVCNFQAMSDDLGRVLLDVWLTIKKLWARVPMHLLSMCCGHKFKEGTSVIFLFLPALLFYF